MFDRAHTLTVAAKCLADDGRNPKLVEDVMAIAVSEPETKRKRAEEREQKRQADAHWYREMQRIERQRTLFNMLPDTRSVENLKEGMLARARELLDQGDERSCAAADAILEFLPSTDAERLLREFFPED